jgi:hypothetical protein
VGSYLVLRCQPSDAVSGTLSDIAILIRSEVPQLRASYWYSKLGRSGTSRALTGSVLVVIFLIIREQLREPVYQA